MLKKPITFKDLDGNEITEDFYFNLSKAEIAELELSHEGGLSEYLMKLSEKKNGGEIIETFKDIIRKSVGRRSEDGRRFEKNEDITNDFMQTDAYSELFVELVTDSGAALIFIKGIVPADLADEITDKAMETIELPAGDANLPVWVREGREPSPTELREATPEQLRAAFIQKSQGLSVVKTDS